MEELEIREHVDLIREVFYYAQKFDGKTLVLKIDYPIVMESHFSLLIKDLAMMHQTGIRIIIVPGAQERINEILSEYHIEAPFVGDVRISSSQAIPFIKMAAFDVANKFMTQLSAYRVNAVIGNWVRARGLGVIDGVDYENTGRVDKINTESIVELLKDGHIPIFPCIGWSAAGKPYNISSNEIALAVSEALGAQKLFFVTATAGITAEFYQIPPTINLSSGGRVARLNLAQTDELLKLNSGRPGPDLKTMELALKACKKGVERVHLVDGRIEGVILKEIFSNLGIGTMVYSNDYESIRNMRQMDISDVLHLMKPLVDSGILIARSDEDMQQIYPDFVIYEVDGVIHACGALHVFEDGQGEIAAIATNPVYAVMGVGRRILNYLIEKAVKLQLKRVFVLTTQTLDWFQQLGFVESTLESLPEKKRKSYNHQRKSKIFALGLTPASGSRHL